MDEKELKKIAADCKCAQDMYSDENMKPFGQSFPCADCLVLQTHAHALIKAIRDRDKEIERMSAAFQDKVIKQIVAVFQGKGKQ